VRTHALLAQAFASAVMLECAVHSSMLRVLNGKGYCLKLLQKRLVCYVVILFNLHLIVVYFLQLSLRRSLVMTALQCVVVSPVCAF